MSVKVWRWTLSVNRFPVTLIFKTDYLFPSIRYTYRKSLGDGPLIYDRTNFVQSAGVICGIHLMQKCEELTILMKVKQWRNRPGVSQRVPGVLGSQILWHSASECGEFLSLTHWPPLNPRMFLVLVFSRGWEGPRAMERSERDTSLKNKVKPPGIDPVTVRIVVQPLNHYATPGPWQF